MMFAKAFMNASYQVNVTVHRVSGVEVVGDHDIFVVLHVSKSNPYQLKAMRAGEFRLLRGNGNFVKHL